MKFDRVELYQDNSEIVCSYRRLEYCNRLTFKIGIKKAKGVHENFWRNRFLWNIFVLLGMRDKGGEW